MITYCNFVARCKLSVMLTMNLTIFVVIVVIIIHILGRLGWLLSRPNNVGLKCPSVRVYVRPFTKSLFDFNEIWHVGRGRWVMHDGNAVWPYPRSRSRALQSWKSFHFQTLYSTIYNESWQLSTDLFRPDFSYLSSFLCHVTLNLAETSVARSRPSVPYGDNLLMFVVLWILAL